MPADEAEKRLIQLQRILPKTGSVGSYLAGAAVVVIGRLLHFPTPVAALSGAILCFVLRFLAIRRDWRLPVAGHPGRRETDRDTEAQP